MSYNIKAGIAVSVDGVNYFNLTDHNRQPIQYSPQRIEQAQRMADGTMRKMVIANKATYDVSWQMIPSGSQTITSQSGQTISSYQPTVDGNYGAGFIKAFYEKYVFQPIWIKLIFATDNYSGNSHLPSQLASPSTGNYQVLKVFISDFKYTINKRLSLVDYVDVSMQFTEV